MLGKTCVSVGDVNIYFGISLKEETENGTEISKKEITVHELSLGTRGCYLKQ